MKAYEIVKGSDSLDGLKQVERPDPEPGEDEILVRIRATSINYRDQAVMTGKYSGGPVPHNTIPLSDGAGEVIGVGERVTRFKEGDRVAGTFFQGWHDGPPRYLFPTALGSPADGTLTELMVFNENDAVRIPDNLSFEEAACLPCAGVTAWNGLMVAGNRIKPGDTVLVLGTGGVSMLALLFAKAAGARVIGTSSSDEKLERARELGLDEGINYKTTHNNWDEEVLRLIGGIGVDCVVEVGGVGTLMRSMKSVAPGGKIALIGVLSGFEGDTNPHGLMRKGASLHGIFVGNRAMFEEMNEAIEINNIKPPIDKVFPFDEARQAFEYQRSQAHFGKVVISV
ncbi:MAG: NAD(P)-dependent alcohol dehydrogenase [Gammaproteobacteria bacterium]